MKILQLSAENIKRLSVIEITPGGSPVVVIAGENEAGKSSVLDAIEMALGGEKSLPPEPVRRGQEKAKVIADLGDIIVTRRFTTTGSSLTVTNRDGAKFPSPQAMLDGLVGRLSFDPLAFASMKADLQATTLRALAKIDTTDLETSRKKAYDERTLVNRDVTQSDAALAKMPSYPQAGLELQSLDGLAEQLRAVDELARVAADASQSAALAAQKILTHQANVMSLNERVDRLRAELEQAEADVETETLAVSIAEDDHLGKVAARDVALAAVPDRSALASKVTGIESQNRLVVENQQRAALEETATVNRRTAFNLTAEIDRLDAEKADRLAKAKFPIDGLGLDDQGVTWQGLPFAQASTAIRTRVSVAIGLALNPKLKVLLVRNGNDLDAKNLAALAETAAEAGAQIWLEKIAGGNGQTTVVIEDGAVADSAASVLPFAVRAKAVKQ